MYKIRSFQVSRLVTRRAEAWRLARQLARQEGSATLYDALDIEPPIYFDLIESKVQICRCNAEARLLRAIFNEAHPTTCSEPANV